MACSGRINIFNTSNRCLSSILLWKHTELDKVTTDPVFPRSSDRYILHRWLHSDSLLMEWLLWTFPSTSLLFYWCVLRCMLHFGCQTVYQKTNSITLSRRYFFNICPYKLQYLPAESSFFSVLILAMTFAGCCICFEISRRSSRGCPAWRCYHSAGPFHLKSKVRIPLWKFNLVKISHKLTLLQSSTYKMFSFYEAADR